MSADRGVREKELLPNLAVRQLVGGHPGDLQFLCRQLQPKVDSAHQSATRTTSEDAV